MRVERWWTTNREVLSAGWHPWRWQFGVKLDLAMQNAALHFGPTTLLFSWWGLQYVPFAASLTSKGSNNGS